MQNLIEESNRISYMKMMDSQWSIPKTKKHMNLPAYKQSKLSIPHSIILKLKSWNKKTLRSNYD